VVVWNLATRRKSTGWSEMGARSAASRSAQTAIYLSSEFQCGSLDVSTGKEVARLPNNESDETLVDSFAFSPNGKWLAAGLRVGT